MQITINIDDKEKLLDALNNSIVAFGDIINAFYLGCDIPSKWQKWVDDRNSTHEDCYIELSSRYELLKEVYQQIEKEM